jgi:hypothetical protein
MPRNDDIYEVMRGMKTSIKAMNEAIDSALNKQKPQEKKENGFDMQDYARKVLGF